jgi:glycosyltransferase involved in cell wall biosynthesis
VAFPDHIVILNVYFAPHSYGGATVVAEAVARELAQSHGCRVSAISSMVRPELVPYSVMRAEQDGIQNYMINLPRDLSYAERYTNPRAAEIIAGLLDDLQPDLLHGHCLQDIGAGIFSLARRRNLPAVLSVHDFWWICEHQFMIRPNGRYCAQDPVQTEACRGCVENMARTRMRQEVLWAEAAAAGLVTFPSRFAHDLTLASGLPARRSAVWENGVQGPGPGFFTAQAARRAADPHPVFGFVGGPSQIKGWPLIRGAFEQIARDDFAGFLVDASLDGSWWRDIDITGLQGDWQIHPRFSQAGMDAFYAGIDVLLFPSQWKETFGLTVREAAARGIRVIQTDSGGTTEWAGAEPGRMLRIGDGPEALVAAVQAVLNAPGDHPAPHPVTSYGEQAAAFLELVAPLAANNRRSG